MPVGILTNTILVSISTILIRILMYYTWNLNGHLISHIFWKLLEAPLIHSDYYDKKDRQYSQVGSLNLFLRPFSCMQTGYEKLVSSHEWATAH